MANYNTQFACKLNVGSAEKVARALDLYRSFDAELNEQDGCAGFAIEAAPDSDATSVILTDDGQGDVENVIGFVLRCAHAFDLMGRWGFTFAHTCSRARLDGFGGGGQVLDLERRESLGWMDCDHWLAERIAEESLP